MFSRSKNLLRKLNTVISKEGRKINVTSVAKNRPNNTIAPTPRYNSVPAPGIKTRGDNQQTVVIIDIMIGFSLDSTAEITAFTGNIPSARKLVSA